MTKSLNSPLGVCVLPEAGSNAARTVSYPNYIHEILKHAGVCYQNVILEDLPEILPHLKLLLTVGEHPLSGEVKGLLRDWVSAGGAWLSVAGACGAGELFGAEAEPPASAKWRCGGAGVLGEGYLKPRDSSHPVLEHIRIPLHYFNGLPVKQAGGDALATILDAHQRTTERAGIIENTVGNGKTLLICPDITGTVVRIQQGVAVTRDGLSAPDGSSSICDAALKTDDGAVLDWIFDREPAPGAPDLRAFLQPVADQWRETLLRAIFYLAKEHNVALPVLWLYPRNLPALAHLSHDSDGNDPACAVKMLETLSAAGIKSTWCIITPGYGHEVINAIRNNGHELALHFDAYTEGTNWSEAELDSQWKHIVELFGGERPISNKNHFLRWEGDTEFFEWLERHGIEFDANKGASKIGEVGFNFGFCHPYFPIDPKGRLLNVLEISTLSQDLGHFAPVEIADPILDAALRVHGIMHLVFHPAHIVKPNVKDNLVSLINKAKAFGMEWWTGRRINAWERARRGVQWNDYVQSANGASVYLRTGNALSKASIMWLAAANTQARVNGSEIGSQIVERWGFEFRSVTVDLEQEQNYLLEITNVGNS